MYTNGNKAAAHKRVFERAIEALQPVFGSGLKAVNKHLRHNSQWSAAFLPRQRRPVQRCRETHGFFYYRRLRRGLLKTTLACEGARRSGPWCEPRRHEIFGCGYQRGGSVTHASRCCMDQGREWGADRRPRGSYCRLSLPARPGVTCAHAVTPRIAEFPAGHIVCGG